MKAELMTTCQSIIRLLQDVRLNTYLILARNFRDDLGDRTLKLFNADILKYNRAWGKNTHIGSHFLSLKRDRVFIHQPSNIMLTAA